MVEAIVNLRGTRCIRISDSLVVDALLRTSMAVERWIASFDKVRLWCHVTARVRVRHRDADVPSTGFED